MNVWPGFSSPSPPPPAPPPPVPKRTQPEVSEAGDEARRSEKRRRGRRAFNLTSGDTLGNPNVDRPMARSATNLGG